MSSAPLLASGEARATNVVSPIIHMPAPLHFARSSLLHDYLDSSSPYTEPDVLSNRFGTGHDLPSAFNDEVVMQLAELKRMRSLHAQIRPQQARLAPVPEEISATPYYPLQPLSIWKRPTTGIARYGAGYVKLPPGSYNNWITR